MGTEVLKISIANLILGSVLNGLVVAPTFGREILNCPWNGYSKSWLKHFSKSHYLPEAYIMMADLPIIPNDKLWKGACFKLTVTPPGHHYSNSGTYRLDGYLNNDWPGLYLMTGGNGTSAVSRWNHVTHAWNALNWPAMKTPKFEKFEINIIDSIFIYNEAGELYHKDYGRVGKLTCDVPANNEPCHVGKAPVGGFEYDTLW